MSAGFLPPVVAEIVAEVGKFSAAMGETKAEMTGLQAATTKLAAAGKVAMLGLAAAVVGVGYESVKLAANFDQTMELVHTQAGASQAEVDALKDSVLKLAPAVGIGPEKLAEGLYHIESTGFRGKEAMDILAASAKLAAMGMADLDTVTFAMSGVMSVAMKDVKSAADATNYLNTIVGMGDMKMDKLAAAIGTGVLPSFKSAGLGMKDFGAALATITDNSTPADEAATRLRMTISLMAAPSGPAVKALHSIGLTSMSLANDLRKPDGLLTAVMDLKHHLEKSGQSAVEQNATIEHAFGGGKTSGAILTLLEETDRLKSKYKALGTEASRAKTAHEAWAAQQQQFSQQLKELGAAAQVLGVKIGNWLIPKIQATATWMSKHIEVVKILAMVVGGVLVAAMVAFTATLVANAAAAMANPITWIVLAIVAAIALLVVGIYELVKHWKTVWAWIKRIAMDVWHPLVDAWHWLVKAFHTGVMWLYQNVILPIGRWFKQWVLRPIEAVLTVLRAIWDFAWGFFSVIVKDFVVVWKREWTAITTIAKWAWNNVIQPVINFIINYGIHPVMWAIGMLRKGWDIAWAAIKNAAKWAWENVIKPVFSFIDKYGITPIKKAIGLLKEGWHVAWEGIKKIIQAAWDILKPVFDKIGGAINTVKNGISAVLNAPGKAGAWIAHILGFKEGGTVPGPEGAPRLAVVHGGEEILSNDQIRAMGRRPTPVGGAGGRSVGGGGEGDIHVHLTVIDKDGRTQRKELLRYARRAGIAPIDLFPASARAI
jgi:TP901 family phage tail tape measure protein